MDTLKNLAEICKALESVSSDIRSNKTKIQEELKNFKPTTKNEACLVTVFHLMMQHEDEAEDYPGRSPRSEPVSCSPGDSSSRIIGR